MWLHASSVSLGRKSSKGQIPGLGAFPSVTAHARLGALPGLGVLFMHAGRTGPCQEGIWLQEQPWAARERPVSSQEPLAGR